MGEFRYHLTVRLGNIQWSQCWPGNQRRVIIEVVSFQFLSLTQKNSFKVTLCCHDFQLVRSLSGSEAMIFLLRGPLQREQQTSLSRGGFWCVVRVYSKHGGSCGSLCPCVYLTLDHYCPSYQWLQHLSVTPILA